MAWFKGKRTDPPPREVLELHVGTLRGYLYSSQVRVSYERNTGTCSTTVGVKLPGHPIMGCFTVFDDTLDTQASSGARDAVWKEAAVLAALQAEQVSSAASAQAEQDEQAVMNIPQHNMMPYSYTLQSQTMMESSGYFGSSVGAYIGTSGGPMAQYGHGYNGPPVVVNPKLPKAGDQVRDGQGRVVGIMCEDGTIESVDQAVSNAIAAAEADGLPVEPQTMKRAIDFAFGSKK